MEKLGFKYTVQISRWDIGELMTQLTIENEAGQKIDIPIFYHIEESLNQVAQIVSVLDSIVTGESE